MIERQGRLDQSGHAGGRHGVADHRRDGPEGPASVRRRGEDGVQGAELGPIGRGHAQAVALDQHHRGRVDSRPAIGPAHRAGMPAGAGRGQALALAVAGQPDALNDGVDSIAVALGVGPALQDHDAHAFAREHPVGVGRERPGGPRARQGVELAEDQREIDVGLEVDAAGDGQVGPSLEQCPRREVERDQRRGTGGVDDEAGSAQIEPVGEAPGRGVGQLAGDRRRLERRQTGPEIGPDRFPVGLGPLGMESSQGSPVSGRSSGRAEAASGCRG